MIGTVRIIVVRYLESEIYEGSIPHECYENARTEEYEVDSVEEAVQVIEDYGLNFSATGTDWAADPDGSYVSNYATGEHCEETAHLYGFTPEHVEQIIEKVG